jgi:hypothetical protein
MPEKNDQTDKSESEPLYESTSLLVDRYHHDQPERHVFGLAFHMPVDPQPVGTVAFPGISDTPAREDHVHAGSGGGGTAGQGYRHIQATSSTIWNITHNLPFYPNVSVVDSTGGQIFPGSVTYVNATTVQLTFSANVGGEAYLS